MKNYARRVSTLLSGLALGVMVSCFAVQFAGAQDPLKVAPAMYKPVFENERVRVMEVTFKPGEKIAVHSHPDHFVYVLSAGKLRVTNADGKVTDADLTVGQVVWFSAETHSAVNTGTTEVRALVTELKEPAPKVDGVPAKSAK